MSRYVTLTGILKIVDGNTGQTIEELDRKGALARAEQVMAPGTAYQITSITTDNVARAPEYGLNSPLQPGDAAACGGSHPLKDREDIRWAL